jgi:hypothetical protein
VTGGRNGYGAKLANIFSTEFTVETASSGSGSRYKQVWKDNMLICGKPSIKDNAKGEDWTKISFVPDLAKFGMEALDDDIVALMTRRVYDIAGSTRGVKVRRPPRDAARAPSGGALPLSRARAPPAAGAPQRREAQGGQLPEVRRAVRRAEARRRAAHLREVRRAVGGVRRGVGRRLPAGVVRQLDRDVVEGGRHAREARDGPGDRQGARDAEEEAQGDREGGEGQPDPVVR